MEPSFPWAQAIQFALERHVDPSAIVEELLSQPDDTFDTHARLLGRCIANGMRVSDSQRRTVTLRLLSTWIPEHFSKARAVGHLLADADGRRSISSCLQTGLIGRLEMYSFASASIRKTQIYPGTRLLLPLLSEWADKAHYEACDALRMTLDLVRLGWNSALADVRPRRGSALIAAKAGAREVHFQDNVIGNAADLLQDRRDPLSLVELENIARSRTHNASMSALRVIARQGTTDACESLMGLYRELTDISLRGAILASLQTLATQIGLRVSVDGERLAISAV